VTPITAGASNAARARTAIIERHQSFDHQRLWADLLSAVAMSFNLFGDLAADLELADRAVHTWWPDAPGTVSDVRFAHSPGREGAVPRGTGEQMPMLPGRSQAMHVLPHLVAQQTPSAQTPLPHWASQEQRLPLAKVPPIVSGVQAGPVGRWSTLASPVEPTGASVEVDVPPSASISPHSSRISVVLPAPFRPRSPIRSFGSTRNVTASGSGAPRRW